MADVDVDRWKTVFQGMLFQLDKDSTLPDSEYREILEYVKERCDFYLNDGELHEVEVVQSPSTPEDVISQGDREIYPSNIEEYKRRKARGQKTRPRPEDQAGT